MLDSILVRAHQQVATGKGRLESGSGGLPMPRAAPTQGPIARRVGTAAVRLRPRLTVIQAAMLLIFFGLIVVPGLLPDSPVARTLAGTANRLIWEVCTAPAFGNLHRKRRQGSCLRIAEGNNERQLFRPL